MVKLRIRDVTVTADSATEALELLKAAGIDQPRVSEPPRDHTMSVVVNANTNAELGRIEASFSSSPSVVVERTIAEMKAAAASCTGLADADRALLAKELDALHDELRRPDSRRATPDAVHRRIADIEKLCRTAESLTALWPVWADAFRRWFAA